MNEKGLSKIIILIISVVVIIGLASVTFFVVFQPPKEEWHLTVYAQGVEESWRAILEEFKKEHPQLKDYTLYVQSAGKISERFLTEERTGKHIADVIVAETGVLEFSIKEGFLAYYEPPNAKSLMQYSFFSRYAKPGYYYPFRFLVQGIGINTEYVDPALISSYEDLTKPDIINKYKGRIGMADPRYTVAIELYYFMNATYGHEFWERLSPLEPVLEPKSTVAIEDLASGKIVILIGALGHLFSDTDKPVKFIYPKEGVVLTPVCAAISKNAPNTNAAKEFVNWLFTKKAAELLVKTRGGDPAYPGLALPGMKPVDQLLLVPQDYSKYHSVPSEKIIEDWAKTFKISG
ncbi:MAG: extracellular solute-binding protein [Saccharolobus sp.]|uniref:ABC transporter substrate-binding protein n=1 Tax=Saccharolobus sp. TaxID=2100761 RepID=UPI00316E5C96